MRCFGASRFLIISLHIPAFQQRFLDKLVYFSFAKKQNQLNKWSFYEKVADKVFMKQQNNKKGKHFAKQQNHMQNDLTL